MRINKILKFFKMINIGQNQINCVFWKPVDGIINVQLQIVKIIMFGVKKFYLELFIRIKLYNMRVILINF
jgi:hypothetical protein